jgi:[ribosomal protein S5]-alanine N-acetyltransferase
VIEFDAQRLTADRISLRRFARSDTAALFEMFSHPEVMRYWSRPAMTAMIEAEDLIQQILGDYETGASLPLAIERNSDCAFVGNCTLHHFHAASRRAEIGYSLARPYWGLGYMHEALQVLVTHAFERLDLNRLEADIDPRNLSSARSLGRLGFVKEGVLRERWIVNGEVSDTAYYGLLRSEWRQSRHGKRSVGTPNAVA